MTAIPLYVTIGRQLVGLSRQMHEDGCGEDMIHRMVTRELRGLPPDLADQVARYLDGED